MISVSQFVKMKEAEGYKHLKSSDGFISLGLKVKDWFYSFHVNESSKDVEYRVEFPSRGGIDTKGFIIYNLNHILVKNGVIFRTGE